MVLETHMTLCMTEMDFLKKKKFSLQNWENEPKMDPKQGFLNLLKKFGH